MTVGRRAVGDIPLLRTFASARFRLLLALVLAVFGVLLTVSMMRILLAGGGIPLEDFVPYFAAALRMGAGESPYLAVQLAGPVDAVCLDCYLYPPFLAQVLVPLTALSLDAAKVVWFVVLALAAFGSAWIGAGIGGAARTLERALWTVAATTLFMPVFHADWLGNVSSLVALGAALVALGGAAGGVSAAAMTWLKVSPLAYAPVAFLADRRARLALLVSLVVLFVPSFLLAPSAWLETPGMLWNLLRGSSDTYLNLAPAAMARNNGWPDAAVVVLRGLVVVGGVLAMVAAMWVARRPRGLPLATLLATITMLLIPGALWYHYLAVLLPLAAMAWPCSGTWARLALLAGAVVTSLAGLNAIPIGVAFFSGALMLAVAARTLWPRAGSGGPYHRPHDHAPDTSPT